VWGFTRKRRECYRVGEECVTLRGGGGGTDSMYLATSKGKNRKQRIHRTVNGSREKSEKVARGV